MFGIRHSASVALVVLAGLSLASGCANPNQTPAAGDYQLSLKSKSSKVSPVGIPAPSINDGKDSSALTGGISYTIYGNFGSSANQRRVLYRAIDVKYIKSWVTDASGNQTNGVDIDAEQMPITNTGMARNIYDLKVGTYTLTVVCFMDKAATIPIGTGTAPGIQVVAGPPQYVPVTVKLDDTQKGGITAGIILQDGAD